MERIHTRSTRIFVFRYMYHMYGLSIERGYRGKHCPRCYWANIHLYLYLLQWLPVHSVELIAVKHIHDVADDQRCLGMQLAKANTGDRALTILTSQLIPCLPPTVLTHGFISLSFLNSTPAYLVTLAYLEKDERAVWSVWGHIFIWTITWVNNTTGWVGSVS